MDFSLTKEQKFFKGQVSRALERIVAPFADSIDKTDMFPARAFSRTGRSRYYGIRYPVGYWRHGRRLHSFTILAEELARVSIGFAAIVTMQCLMGTDFIYRFGNAEQKKKYLFRNEGRKDRYDRVYRARLWVRPRGHQDAGSEE